MVTFETHRERVLEIQARGVPGPTDNELITIFNCETGNESNGPTLSNINE